MYSKPPLKNVSGGGGGERERERERERACRKDDSVGSRDGLWRKWKEGAMFALVDNSSS